jgi:hypothetical protein
MSPSALLEIEEKAEELIHLDGVAQIVSAVFALEVSGWTDENLIALETVIDKLIQLLSLNPIAQYRPFIEKLLKAREGVEQGLAPDPAKRPSVDEMRDFVSANL